MIDHPESPDFEQGAASLFGEECPTSARAVVFAALNIHPCPTDPTYIYRGPGGAIHVVFDNKSMDVFANPEGNTLDNIPPIETII